MLGILITIGLCMSGCGATDPAIRIKGGVPAARLNYYQDSFDILKTNLWEIVAFSQTAQMRDFEMADVRCEAGRLKIQTRNGAFSSGIVASKFLLRGDFDIQIDCQVRFLRGNPNIDQLFYITIIKQGDTFQTGRSASLALAKPERADIGLMQVVQRRQGKYVKGNARRISEFSGSIRLVRMAHRIAIYYRQGRDSDWHRLDETDFISDDVAVTFGGQNFLIDRKRLSATESVTVYFDNFRINAAADVIEKEI